MFKFNSFSYERTYFATVPLHFILKLKDEQLFNNICSSLPHQTGLIVRAMRSTKQLMYLTNCLTLPSQSTELLTVDDTVRTLHSFTVDSQQRFICNSVLNQFGIDGLIEYIELCYNDDFIVISRNVISTLVKSIMYNYITEFRDVLGTTVVTTRTFTVVAPQGQTPYDFDDFKL